MTELISMARLASTSVSLRVPSSRPVKHYCRLICARYKSKRYRANNASSIYKTYLIRERCFDALCGSYVAPRGDPERGKIQIRVCRCNVLSSHLVYLTDVGKLVGEKIEVAGREGRKSWTTAPRRSEESGVGEEDQHRLGLGVDEWVKFILGSWDLIT
jgi:hypothetical protein